MKKKQLEEAIAHVDEDMNVTFSEPVVVSPSTSKYEEDKVGNKEGHTSFLGNEQAIPKVIQDSSSFLPTPNPNARIIPSWYMFFKRSHVKKEIIRQRLEEYCKPVKAGSIDYTPSYDDVHAYEKQLKGLTLKELLLMGSLKKYDLKLDPLDRLKSIKKKKHAVVTIFNDNKTTDTGVIHCYDRTFSRSKMSYLVISSRGIYDPEFKMMHFYYFANNPFPLKMDKFPLDESIMDASLQDSVIEAKVIETLAAIDIDKKINLILIISILIFIITAVILIVCLRGFKVF